MSTKRYFNEILSQNSTQPVEYYKAIDWNQVEDMIDKLTWEKLTEQFWLDTRIPVSNDLDDWRTLSPEEKDVVGKVFGGLTLLDTLQSEEGASLMQDYVRTQHEEAVWTNNNEYLQFKAKKINEIYQSRDALKMKVASTMLETFLFYSGFFTPLYYLGNNKLANVAEIIKLIIRDESVHGTYTGYKFQQGYNELSEPEQEEMKMWVYNLCLELYQNEVKYTQSIYDQVGWTEKVKVFIRYNANKALQNLGFDPLFPDTAEDVDPIVMNGISTGTSNHDFFSQVGNGYLLGSVEAMDDEDYTKWL